MAEITTNTRHSVSAATFAKLLLLSFFFAGTVNGFGAEIVVSPSGSVRTITQALRAARDGDRIVIKTGTYREGNLIIDKAVELIGEGAPVIDGEEKTEVLTVTASGVRISGLVIANAGRSFIDDNAAIRLRDVRHCVIENNRLINNFFGVYLAKSAECRIAGNVIVSSSHREVDSGNGIHLWYSKNIVIENNQISGHRDGIYFEFVENSQIRGNRSEDNLRYGLHFMFSHHCHYTDNLFRHNGAGVAVMYTRDVEMLHNRFEQNWGSASFGILLKEITDSRIAGNVFVENTIGLYAEGSNRLHVENNIFQKNGWAAKIMANAMDNVFVGNDFIDNSFDVATNSRQNFNKFRGNFWSGYKGYDLDSDGVGDIPFRPVRLFSLIVEKQASSLILLRSFFIDMLDLAEQMIPALTPETLIDERPAMKRINADAASMSAEALTCNQQTAGPHFVEH